MFDKVTEKEIDKMDNNILQIQKHEHPNCLLCNSADILGLRMFINKIKNGEVSSHIDFSHLLQSYPGILHGGIISLIFDGVMINCLFSANIIAVTTRLEIRYIQPVDIGREIHIKARVLRTKGALHYVEAELLQRKIFKARASGSFINRSEHTTY